MNDIVGQWPALLPQFLPGLWVSIKLTICALVIGLPFGVLLAVLSGSPTRWIRMLTIAVIEIGRGTPGLVVLYIVYYGLPQVGVVFSAFIAASLGLGFTTAAYTAEIIRAGIKAVPHGQTEAASALSLSYRQEMRLIVLPQALRKVLPPLVGWGVLLFQGTSLAYAISVPELLSRAYNIATITYQFTSTLLLAGLMYSLVTLAVTLTAGRRIRAL